MKKNILIVADQMAECLYLKEQLQEVPTDIFCTSYIDDTVNALTKSRSLGFAYFRAQLFFYRRLRAFGTLPSFMLYTNSSIAPSNDVKDKVLRFRARCR